MVRMVLLESLIAWTTLMSPGPDGDTSVRLSERRRVVNAVAHPADRRALSLERSDLGGLVAGKDLRHDSVHPDALADCSRHGLAVAREHHDLEPHRLKLGHGRCGLRSQRVRDPEHAGRPAVHGDKKRRAPARRQLARTLVECIRS